MWLFDKIARVRENLLEIGEARQEKKLWDLRSAAWGNEPSDKQVALAFRAGFIQAVEGLCLNAGLKDYKAGESLSLFTSQWVDSLRGIKISHSNEINKRTNASNGTFQINVEGKETCCWRRDEHGRVVEFKMTDANAKWMGPLMYAAREARRPSQVKYFPAPAV